ncbi:MAG: lamin tail domain-containing protein, partial [Patescibacteria group bacterium]
GSTFSCQLDNATSGACVSPKEYINLAEGSHIFKVVATDAAGNQDATPAEHFWSVSLSAPNLSNISSMSTRTSAVISWTSDKTGIFQAEYGTSTNYGLLSAATAESTLNLSSLASATAYHYRLLAQDSSGNATTTRDYNFETSSLAENIVISEIQIAGATASDEFIELYNPTSGDINLSGWKLARRTATATSSYSNLVSSFNDAVIPAKGYFLVAHPTGYDGGVPADTFYSSVGYSVAANNAIILYSDSGQTIVDLVGLGVAASFEGNAATVNPAAHASVERKANVTSMADSLYAGDHKWQGNGYDSNNNLNDFILQSVAAPQNSLMLIEPRSSLPNIMTAAVWPVWQGNQKRTGQLAVNALATSTMQVKWTATTTGAKTFSSRPSVDDEGNIYLGRQDGLAKYSSSGQLLWLYATSTSYGPPLILADNTIVFRGAWGLFAVNKEGQSKWKYALSGSGGKPGEPAILSDGTLLTFSNEKIYAINQDATLKWIFDPFRALQSGSSIGAFTIDAVDNIYVAIDKYLYAISPAGVKLWEQNFGNCSSVALSDNGILYFTASGTIATTSGAYAINANDGAVIWVNNSGSKSDSSLAPIVDVGGNVYSILNVGGGPRLSAYATTSVPIWTQVNLESGSLAAPLITADNKIYLASLRSLLVIDSSSGAVLGIFSTLGSKVLFSLFGAMAADGTIYLGNSENLYAIDDQ